MYLASVGSSKAFAISGETIRLISLLFIPRPLYILRRSSAAWAAIAGSAELSFAVTESVVAAGFGAT